MNHGQLLLLGGLDMTIQFNRFSFTYRSQSEPTLRDINLTIEEGERVLIVGPSGSGKSTLAQCINGLIPFSYPGTWEGDVLINGIDARTLSLFDRSALIGTVLQDPDTQFIGLSVGEDIAFALENKQVARPEMHDTVERVARLTDVAHLLTHRLNDLSGGQRQRAALGGVLVEDANILLFDEPLANLDPLAGSEAMALLDRLQHETKRTLVVVEHRIEDVLSVPFDRMIVVVDGEIVADGHPDDVLSDGSLARACLREPLYLSAARWADILIRPDDKPSQPEAFLDRFERQPIVSRLNTQTLPVPSEASPSLELNHVSFRYRTDETVLEEVSMRCEIGTLTTLVGQNGAGKSTLAKVLSGYQRATNGQICLNGTDVTKQSIAERATRIGFVLQNPNHMISKQTVREEVRYGMQALALDVDEEERRLEETLRRCGLYPFRNWPIQALSFGQKKRVTIASILVRQPDVLILDEPTAGQDYRHYSEMMDFLERLKQDGMTLLIITHDMHLVLEYSDQVCLLQAGRIRYAGEPFALFAQESLLRHAHLKQTSLFTVAQHLDIEVRPFLHSVIQAERKERAQWE